MIIEDPEAHFYRFRFYRNLAIASSVLLLGSAGWRLAKAGTSATRKIGTLANVGGNGCFVNAVLQLLSSSMHFRSFCVESEVKLVHHLGSFLASLNHSDETVSPRSLLVQLFAAFKLPDLSAQQDSHEFLLLLLDQLVPKQQHDMQAGVLCVPDCPFVSLYAQTSKCSRCDYDTGLHVLLHSIVHVSWGQSVKACIQKLFSIEKIHGQCAKCGHPSLYCKQVLLRPPRMLLLHINRLVMRPDRRCEKLDDPVSMDKQVRFGKHKYRLKSWIEHSGGAMGGHYYALKLHNGDWFRVSDARCEHVPDVGAYTARPYLCLYERD